MSTHASVYLLQWLPAHSLRQYSFSKTGSSPGGGGKHGFEAAARVSRSYTQATTKFASEPDVSSVIHLTTHLNSGYGEARCRERSQCPTLVSLTCLLTHRESECR